MIKKLTNIGSSVGLILDKALLELYHFEDNVELIPTADGLLIKPTSKTLEERRKRVGSALQKANARYGRTLKKLAK